MFVFSGGVCPLAEPFVLCRANPRREIALSSTVSLASSGLAHSELLIVECNDAAPTLLESLGIGDKVNTPITTCLCKMTVMAF